MRFYEDYQRGEVISPYYDFICQSCGKQEERAVPVSREGLVAVQTCGCGGQMDRQIPHSMRFKIEGGGAVAEIAGRNVSRTKRIKDKIFKKRYEG